MTYRHIAVVLNGKYPWPEYQLALLDSCDYIIAADGGINWLHANGRIANVLIGDLDSATQEALLACQAAGCHIEKYPPEKDETDAELALILAASLNPSEITLLGATGGRVDHLLANILLLYMDVLKELKVAIYDGESFVFIIRDCVEIKGEPGDLLSLVPLGGDVVGVRTAGLYYPLVDEPLCVGAARGISNVFTDSVATVEIQQGTLLAIHTPRQGSGQ